MRGGRGALTGAAFVLAFLALLASGACSARAGRHAIPPGQGWVAPFSGEVEGRDGAARLRGVLAIDGEGRRLRAEISPPGAPAPLIVIAGPEGFAAVNPMAREIVRAESGSRLLGALTGLDLDPIVLVVLVKGGGGEMPGGCTDRSPLAALPRRVIRLTCPAGRIHLKLGRPRPLDPSAARTPFELPGDAPGYRSVTVEEFVGSIGGLGRG